MALVNPETVVAQARGFNALPFLRQIGLMVGLAASVALGVALALWSSTPNYSPLYGKLPDSEAAKVIEELARADIPYRMDGGKGVITVPSSKLHDARIKLATVGLPKKSGYGYEVLEEETGFGASRFVEQTRYQRAMEGELARSIASLQNVESARVHLAIPKRSAFMRGKSKAQASVVLNLYAGTQLDENRLAGIAHLVAASIPELEADQVTVVDQMGRLLSASSSHKEITLSANQLNHSRRVEDMYIKRIHDILSPIVGSDGVRAQVSVDIDYTMEEQTAESYAPDNKAVRSEESFEEKTGGMGTAGVPGALTNQPPAAGTTEQADGQIAEEPSTNSSRRSMRNYELDKSITHTRTAPGKIQRLSVAVVINDRIKAGSKKGKGKRVPFEEEELQRITALVKDAVGFDGSRNDSVNVTNIPFQVMEEVEPLPDPPIWKQAWVWDVVKQVVGVLLVLGVAFGVLKPVLSNLVTKAESIPSAAALQAGQLPMGAEGGQVPMLGAQQDQQFGMARTMIDNDPARVAQVMKTWVGDDG